jgi:hypothetical protein
LHGRIHHGITADICDFVSQVRGGYPVGLSGLVDVRAVFDAMDLHNVGFEVDCKQHFVVTATVSVPTEKFIRKGPAQAERVLAQDPGAGLDVLGERWALLALREIPLALFERRYP